VRVLLDECVDWRLSRDLVGHDVKSALQMGWAGSKNGELLTHASEQFDVFVTVDRNLSSQLVPAAFSIAIIVLASKNNRLADLKPLVQKLLNAIESARPGTVTVVNSQPG
jgi:hypothetical protein